MSGKVSVRYVARQPHLIPKSHYYMKLGVLLSVAGNQPCFDTGLLLAGGVDSTDVRLQLSLCVSAGKIRHLRRGLCKFAHSFLLPMLKCQVRTLVGNRYWNQRATIRGTGWALLLPSLRQTRGE
jgi:hypothetical protein